MAYLMGIDVGTSSAKAIIMDEKGSIVGHGAHGYDFDISHPSYAEQDCHILWNSTCKAIKLALEQSGKKSDISAIGISGQMHGLVMLDGDKKPIRPIIIWADKRSSDQVAELKILGLAERVGNPIATGFFLPSLLWIKQHEPHHFEKIRYLMMPKDYIRFRFTGEIGTDFSDASGTLLYNLTENDWDRATIEKYEIPYDVLPDCHNSCEIAGTITPQAANDTDLKLGTPVVFGGGDTPMMLTGNGVIGDMQISTNIGTASQICYVCPFVPATGGKLNTFHHIPADKWISVGASLNGGVVLEWLRSTLLAKSAGFQDMDKIAQKSAPGANGVVMLPFLSGERSPYLDENAKGIFFGLTLSTTINDIIRSAMESIVFSFRNSMSVFKELNYSMKDEIIASGGGARSPLWLQLQADILQKTIRVNNGEEEACKGAALAAGVGCGIYDSLEQACSCVQKLSTVIYEPNPKNIAVYDHNFAIYRSLYENNKTLFSRHSSDI